MVIALVALLVANIFDVVIHVITDQVEPLRITGNVIALVAAGVLLTIPRTRHPWVPLVAGGLSLLLNLVFIATQGIGVLGALLVTLTTLLFVVVAVRLARRHPSKP